MGKDLDRANILQLFESSGDLLDAICTSVKRQNLDTMIISLGGLEVCNQLIRFATRASMTTRSTIGTLTTCWVGTMKLQA